MTVAEFHLAGQHNQATHGDDGGVGQVASKLKSGGTVSLGAGETLAKSDLVQQRGGGGALLAAVDSSDGARRVRLGVIGDEGGVSKWRAADKGATAELSPTQARALADGLTDSSRKARQQHAEADAVIEVLEDTGWDPDNPDLDSEQRDLLDRHDTLTSGLVGNQQTISTPWGDVVYGTRITDGGPTVALAVVSDDADAAWTLDDAVADGTALDLTLAQVRALASKLRANAGTGQTAAVDEFQGNIPEQLADYWLRGKGAARVRWCTRGSFRRARRLLRGKVPAHMLDGTVANLYHRACGRWPGRRGNEAALAADTAALPTETAPDLEVVGEDATGVGYNRVYWSGPLAPIDIATGDRRRFAPGALSTRQLPLQLSWQEKRAQGHDGSVVVGSLTGYEIAEDGTIMGRGYFLDPEIIPEVRKAMHLVEHKVIGPSVDLEPNMDVTWVDEQGDAFDTQQCQIDGTCPDKPEALITEATIVGATLVPITAFAEARAPKMTRHGDFCLNPLHPGPCASGGSGDGGGGGGKGTSKDAKADAEKTAADETQPSAPAQAPGRGVLDTLIREKFLDSPQDANDDQTPEQREAEQQRAAEKAQVEQRRARRAEVRVKTAAARERYGPRSKWPKRVQASIERDEKRVREMASNQTAATSLTACGCATRAGVSEFSVSTDGSTCACDPDGVAKPMAAGGEFCACASSQTADAGEHDDCRDNEFCRAPLHPGPCKGWKKNRGGSSSSSGGKAKSGGGDSSPSGPTGSLGPDTVKGRVYRVERAKSQSAARSALEGADRKDLDAVADEMGIFTRKDWSDKQVKDAIVAESGAPADTDEKPSGPTGPLGPTTVKGRVYRVERARSQAEARAALDGASRSDLLDIAEEMGLGRPGNWSDERLRDEIVKESGAPAGNQTAAVRDDFDDMPFAPRDREWDVAEAESAISRWATDDDGDVDFGRYGRAFIYQDPDGPVDAKSSYKFPVATVIGGELTIVPRAVSAAAGRLNQANVSGDAREQIRETLTDLYDQMAEEFDDDAIQAPWEMATDEADDFDTPDDDDMVGGDVHGGEFCGTCGGDPLEQTAAAYGVFGDIAPHPIERFQRTATGPTPMTILEDGSVFGHIAPWDSCNRGVRGRCLPPPKSKTNYAQFHTVPIRTSEGTLRVGKIVMGEGHADAQGNIQVTRAFYDRAGSTVAQGRAHEDEWGVFFSGVIGPGVTPEQAVEFFSMPPSGHWSEHRPTRSSELIAVAAVNVQGHPTPGPDLVLNQVASGYYEPEADAVDDAAAVFAILDQADWVAEAEGIASTLA
jgi:hypothetical protein